MKSNDGQLNLEHWECGSSVTRPLGFLHFLFKKYGKFPFIGCQWLMWTVSTIFLFEQMWANEITSLPKIFKNIDNEVTVMYYIRSEFSDDNRRVLANWRLYCSTSDVLNVHYYMILHICLIFNEMWWHIRPISTWNIVLFAFLRYYFSFIFHYFFYFLDIVL